MTTATTQIIITAKDSTAAAFSSVENNLTGLAGNAARTAAGIAGIGLSIAGVVDGIRSVAQASLEYERFNNTLRVATGSAQGAAESLKFIRSESARLGLDLASAADQFAKLSAASKGTALEGKATRDIFTAVSQAAVVMGLSAEQTSGSLLAIQQIISKGTVSAEELRGQLGERLPGAFQIAARSIGVTTQELDKLLRTGKLTAEQLLPALTAELNRTFGSQAEQAAQGLQAQINRMNTAFFELKIAVANTGLIDFLSSAIQLATSLANVIGQTVVPKLKELGVGTGLKALFGGGLFSLFSKDSEASVIESSKAIETVSESIKKLDIVSQPASKSVSRITSESERFIQSLKKEAGQAGLTTSEIKRLEAASLGVSRVADPLIDRIDAVNREMLEQQDAAKRLADELRKIESITESVKTKEEKFADTHQELNRLLGRGLGIEQYNRALRKAQDELRGTTIATSTATDQVSQLWIQAGRNIQTTLADSIFNFFDDGLKGMVKNVAAAVGRIASEFAALRIAQGIGLTSIFGATTASAAGGIGGTGAATAINAASLGTSALSLYKSGFGLPSLIGGGIQSLGTFTGASRLAAFGGGFAGDALGGLAAGGFGSGAASAASMGASIGSAFAAAAGPLLVAFAATQGFKALAGDKRIGGGFGNALNTIGDIPIIGDLIPIIPIINGLFGRGPLKQKSTTLSGTIGAEGFTAGALQTDFVAKGGLFRSNKNDFARVDAVTGQVSTDNKKLTEFANQLSKASKDIIGLINETTISATKNLRQIAGDLKLSTAGLEAFNHEINLTSEKGKGLTEEQIGAEIEKISDSLARSLIPEIDNLAKRGETAMQAVSRLGLEFESLVSAGVLLGSTLDDARRFILSASFDQRTAFVDAAGGIDALGQKAAFFADNFLTEAEQIAPVSQRITEELGKLGIAGDITKEQFKQLVQSFGAVNGVTQETLQALLNLAPAFVQVRNYSEELARAERERAEQERQRILQEKERHFAEARRFGDEISRGNDVRRQSIINRLLQSTDNALAAINSHISKLKSLSDAIKSATQSLSPQRIEDARSNIISALNFDKSGNARGIKNINLIDQQSIGTLSGQTSLGFTSRADFIRSQSINLQILNMLARATNRSIFGETQAANLFQRERNNIPSFDVGGVVPKTGIALVHKGERVINPQQNEAIVKLLQDVVNAVKSGSVYSQNTFTLLRDMTNDGLALNTRAAV